jgi:hypothetical protein
VRGDAGSGVNRQIDFVIGYAVDLKADKALLVGLIDILEREIFHRVTIQRSESEALALRCGVCSSPR